jgi:hypothetical protein
VWSKFNGPADDLGVRGDREKKVLRDREATLNNLPITAEVRQLAVDLAGQSRAKGLTTPATDLLVAACARHYDARLCCFFSIRLQDQADLKKRHVRACMRMVLTSATTGQPIRGWRRPTSSQPAGGG